MNIRPFLPADENSVIALWNACGLTRPWNDPQRDIQRRLEVRPNWFLVGTIDNLLVATVMVGYDGHRGWIYYLGVLPEFQNRGLGRRLIETAEQLLRESGCPKLNLQIRGSNRAAIGFYERLGYLPDEVISYGKRLIPDQ